MEGHDVTTSALARKHELHAVQPVLPVPDLAAALDWWVRVLGMSVDFVYGEPPHYARVRAGDRSFGDPIYIHLQRHCVDNGPLTPCGETRLYCGRDIDGLHAHAVAQGAEVVHAPQDQPWGLRDMTLRAPGGHLVVIGGYLGMPPVEQRARAVIASYTPKPDQAEALLELVRSHVPTLQRLGLATSRAPFVMQAGDGSIVEVFEWASAEAIERAHHLPEVRGMWQRFDALCSFGPLSRLAECGQMFPEFSSL